MRGRPFTRFVMISASKDLRMSFSNGDNSPRAFTEPSNTDRNSISSSFSESSKLVRASTYSSFCYILPIVNDPMVPWPS
jgi:hypothetical protein